MCVFFAVMATGLDDQVKQLEFEKEKIAAVCGRLHHFLRVM